MGILLENDYKKIISGEKSPLQLFSTSSLGLSSSSRGSRRQSSSNPLLKIDEETSEDAEPDKRSHIQDDKIETPTEKLTYERMNRDSTLR